MCCWSITGWLDGKVRRTALNFDPPPDRLKTDAAVYNLRLDPGPTRPIFVAVSCDRRCAHATAYTGSLLVLRL